jgi:hypothetical protein
LHAIVAGAVGAVNPQVQATLISGQGGYTTQSDGTQVPVLAPPVTVTVQVQGLSVPDLQKLDSLNVQNSTHKVYMSGILDAANRTRVTGGDTITLDSGEVYLVTQVLEQWPDWVAASVTLQLS